MVLHAPGTGGKFCGRAPGTIGAFIIRIKFFFFGGGVYCTIYSFGTIEILFFGNPKKE